ncbi:Metallo-dependent phosphatase [Rhizodiscina lignyota]|uniref:Metallo-dependent phosphatase n=1 Tax=Rhizodiscina lignyota TaxID=1504668 RepID=A0A9P4I9Z2_9PEZI|nr:Metallo-dependent phosphatase [Rhizodiscina lignyota]
MVTPADVITALSSTALRLSAYHAPPVAYTGFAIWLVSFLQIFLRSTPYDVLSDEVDIIVKEPEETETNGNVDLIEGAEDGVLEELDVEETIVVEKKDPQILQTLLFGLPSPSSTLWTFLTAAINIMLILMVTDYIFTPQWFYQVDDLSFARVGYVSSSTASLLVREPQSNELPIRLSYREAEQASDDTSGEIDSTWKHAGTISALSNDTDYTYHITLTGLQADVRYQYAFTNNQTGFFRTAPPVGKLPKRDGGKFTFLHSSCMKVRVPYVPWSHPLSMFGLRDLARQIPHLKASFMVFLGDFIYIDVPHRFGSDIDTYRREYRRQYSSPDWPAAAKELPWIHVYDDHEIANDWDNGTSGVYPAASDAFQLYHASVNPPTHRQDQTYFSFIQGPASFFMLDARKYRSHNNDPAHGKTMLGAAQLADFLTWLRAPTPRGVRWKFVISSVPFTKNWHYSGNDTWGAFLEERQIVLEAMWDATTRGTGVIVLSGDRHEFAATRFPPPEGEEKGRKEVVEFSASPLNMFYLPIRTYQQTDGEDITIKYLPDGNSKFGAIEITSPRASDQSMLHYRLFIDGEEAWSYTMSSPLSGHWSLWG